jgi:uncharacterized protein (TIGR02453 family)
MLQASTLDFLKNLKKNNNKEWFDANRKAYETARNNFIDVTATVLQGIGKVDESLAKLEPKKCIFRINRDVRFSKDKSPYKTNFGMSFSRGGKNAMSAGYYFHLEPEECFIGGGIYMPMPNEVKKIRQEIDYNFADFKKIIHQRTFVQTFNNLDFSKEFSLQRPPKGYDESNEAIDYLKLKTWIVSLKVTEPEILDKNLPNRIIKAFEVMQPFIFFLNNALGVEG